MKKQFQIAKIFGIKITLHYSWFFIAILLAYGLAAGYFPQNFPDLTKLEYGIMGLTAAMLLFASVLFHELCHALVAKHYKIPIEKIQLFFFGGVAFMKDDQQKPKTEFLMAIAGPLSSLLLAGIFFYIQTTQIHIQAIIHYLARINLVLAIFNLVPGFPLDGGRAFRAVIWWYTGNYEKATYIASRGGKIFGGLLVFLGFLNIFMGSFGGMWFVLIGAFLYFLAEMSFEQTIIKKVMQKVLVKDVMRKKFRKLAPSQKLDEVIKYFLLERQSVFPVFQKDKAIGFLTIDKVKEIPLHLRHKLKVKDALTSIKKFNKLKEEDNLYKVILKFSQKPSPVYPVIKNKKLVGILTHDRIMNFIRTKIALKI